MTGHAMHTALATANAPAALAGRAIALSARSPQPIRVAHLIHTMAHGGVETALINWFTTFSPEHVEAHLICFANPDGSEQPFVDAATRAGLRVHTVPWGRRKPFWRAAKAAAAFLKAHDIELLHCHNTYANVVGLCAARMASVKTLTTIYVWSGYGVKRRLLQFLDQRLLSGFDQITAHCQAALTTTAERGVPSTDIRLLTCGFSDRVAQLSGDDRASARRSLGVADGETVLIKVARFWPEKRHDVLLHAFKHLLTKTADVQLWIPGVGPEFERVLSLAESLGVASRCRFLGFRTDLPELLAMADIQVHTSDEEGVPLAILSGMAAGKPVVSTRVGGIAEVIRSGESGVLIERRQPEQFADAVFELMRDGARQQRLGDAARQFIDNEYSLAAATRRVERLYEEMVAR
jgi:glycosyltransferase involved in cell wall biosynthesis